MDLPVCTDSLLSEFLFFLKDPKGPMHCLHIVGLMGKKQL